MASLSKVATRNSRKRVPPKTSNGYLDALESKNRGRLTLHERQLASPPASSGCTPPSSSPDVESLPQDISGSLRKDEVDEDREKDHGEDTDEYETLEPMVPPSDLRTDSLIVSSPSRTLRRAVIETSDASKSLSLAEKVKLLKICCDHGSQFFHCPTSGKHPEEEFWTSVMEKFSTTIRSGVFEKYSDVKKVANKTCRNRRKNTKGNVPPLRRSRMGDLDTWIDRWVRIWKCRDLIVNIANAHQSMREAIGEKKLKRIFRHRIDGDELPQDLGRLTLSPPLWKAIQKRIRVEERSLGTRHISLFPGEDESDWTDDDDYSEDDATEERDDIGLPIQSIEDESTASFSEVSEDMALTPSREVRDFPDPSPRTQARLDQFEQGYATMLKEEKGKTGKRTSILGLALKRQDQEQPESTSSKSEISLEVGSAQALSKEKGSTSPKSCIVDLDSGKDQGEEQDGLTHSSVEKLAAPSGEVGVRQSTGTNPIRSQRLEPGTYVSGEGVPVGFHSRQLILAGMNNTAAKDYRQGVFATIDDSGQIHLRLRSQNMQGKLVPPEFRLNKTVSISHKHKVITYFPKFRGMSYDEMKLEVARQSLLPAHQRPCYDWVPTPAFDTEENRSMSNSKTKEKRPCKDAGSTYDDANGSSNTTLKGIEGGEAAASTSYDADPQTSSGNSRKSLEETSDIPAPTERRIFALSGPPAKQAVGNGPTLTVGGQSSLPKHMPQETKPDRTGTPDVLRKFLADEARKQQKPLAPHRIPHHNSPPRKLNPQGRISNKNRITPSRFYGAELSGQNTAEGDRQLSEALEQPTVLRQPQSGSHAGVGSSQDKMASPILNHCTPNNPDDSDSDSLPEVEELHRRCVRAAKVREAPQSARQHGDYKDPGPDVVDKAISALASPRPRGSEHISSGKDIPTPASHNTDILLGGMINDHQVSAGAQPRGQDGKIGTLPGSKSKKRGRCQSPTTSASNLPDTYTCTDSFKPLTTPKAVGVISPASNEHLAKRQRPPLSSEPIRTPVPAPNIRNYGPKPFSRPSVRSAVQAHGALNGEKEYPSTRPQNKGKGKTAQLHNQNKHFAPDSRSTNGNSHTPKQRAGANNTASSRRFHPYGQSGRSSGSATSQNRRRSGGKGKRERYRGRGYHDRAGGGGHGNNKFQREATIDFENFSLDGKLDYLRSEISVFKDMFKKNIRRDG
ncbi:hypothetical protein F4806DRAFT_483967 [Annulohypoxylon nitens]|nr:hypothetical protein F4806DRAFT_483967 [Annulohypoxylon nitens]